MPTRFLTVSVVALFGVLLGSAQEAAAQDVDPQKATACMQAVDAANYEQVLAACPEVVDALPRITRTTPTGRKPCSTRTASSANRRSLRSSGTASSRTARWRSRRTPGRSS